MALFARTLLAFALLIQAALGPAGMTLDVCHGRLQWAAPEGESCCGDTGCETVSPDEPACDCSHGSDEPMGHAPSEGPGLEERDDCTTCFQVALQGTDEACESPVEKVRTVAGAAALSARPGRSGRPSPIGQRQLSNWPPADVQRPGLLPGTFPMRI